MYFRINSLIKSYIYDPIYLKGHPWGFPGSSDGKESACNAGDPASISRGSFQPRDRTCVSCLAGRFFATEVEEMYKERMELKQHIKQGPA